jgi:O-antigen ligase
MKKISSPENFTLVFLAIITFASAPFFVDTVMLPKFLVLNLYSIIILILILNSFKNFFSLSKFLTLITVSFPIILFISTSKSNQNLHDSLFGIWGRYNGTLLYLCLPLLFILGVLLYSSNFSRKIIDVLTMIGLCQLVIGGLELLNVDLFSYLNKDPYLKLSLGNSNFASIFLVMTFIATLINYLFYATRKLHRNVFMFSLISHILLIVSTRALQGLVALAVSAFLLFWYLASIRLRKEFIDRNKFYFFPIFITLILSIYLIIELKIISLNSLFDRLYIWTAAFGMIKDNLLFGVGVDAFGKWFPLYKETETLQYQVNFENYDSAHNIFLNLGATLGLPALISYLSIVLFVFSRILATRKRFLNNPSIVGLICIWIVFQIQALVSIDHIVLFVWGWLIGGVIVGYSYCCAADSFTEVPVNSKQIKAPAIKSKLKVRSLIFLVILQATFISYAFPTIKGEILIKKYSVNVKYISEQKALGNITPEVLELFKLTNAGIFEVCMSLRSEDLRNYGAVVLANSGEQELAIKLSLDTIYRFPRSINARFILVQIYESKGEAELANQYSREILVLDPLR